MNKVIILVKKILYLFLITTLSNSIYSQISTIENANIEDYYYVKKCGSSSYRTIASPFTTPSSEIKITQIQVRSYETMSGFRVFSRIMTNNAGSPSNTIVTNGTSNWTSVSSTGWITMTFNSGSEPVLSPNTTYFLVIAGDASSSSSACRFYTNNDLGDISKWSTTTNCTAEVWGNCSTNGDICYKIFYEVTQPTVSFQNNSQTSQITFNNSYINTITPTLKVVGTHSSNFNRFQIEINTSSDFSGTSYTQTFSGTYTSGTSYELLCNSLSPSLPTTNNVTYYVRVRASDNGGTNWGDWSSGTFSFTYKSSGDTEWMQTTSAQFNTNSLQNTVINSNSVEIAPFIVGTNTIGTSDDHTGGWFSAKKITISTQITLTSLSVYFASTANATKFTLALYDNSGSGGTPGNRLAITNEVTISGTSGQWYNVPTTTNPVLSAGTYYIAICSNSTNNRLRYVAGSTTDFYAKSFTYNHPLPNPAPTGLTGYTRNYSLYATGYPVGTILSSIINFNSFYQANSWDKILWNSTETGGSVKLQVWYDNSGTPTIIPDSEISGNSTGINSGPIDISELNTSTYNKLQLKAILSSTGGNPKLDDWKISCVFGTDVNSIAENPANQVAATTISSVSNVTSANAKKVFTFKITDQGTSDNKNTIVTNIRIKPGNNNNADWTDHIQGIKLYSENASTWINTSTVSITDTYIDISINSGDLEIPDGESHEISLYIYLNTSNIIDNSILQFKITNNNHGFIADTNGSQFASNFGSSDIIGNNITVIVEATKLVFNTNQPQSTIAKNVEFNVKLYTTDIYGNFDVDFSSGSVSLSVFSGSGSLSALSGLTKNINSGIVEWNDVLYDNNETCSPDNGLKILATHSGTLNSATSQCINVIDAPGNFSITSSNSQGCTGSNFQISWSDSNGATSYDLYWCNASNCNPQTSSNIITGVSSPYNFTVIDQNVVYLFRIKANNLATSTWSTNITTYTTFNQSTWSGNSNTNWSNSSNWCGNSVPQCTDNVTILSGATYYPTLTTNTSVKNIYVEEGANLNLSNYTLNIYGDAIFGNSTITSSSGTITFTKTGCSSASGNQLFDPGNNTYNNINVNTDTLNLINNDLTLNGNLTINFGIFKANNNNINIKGNWTNYSVFDPGSGSVIFSGNTNSTITKNGPEVIVYKTGFEDSDGGILGWKLGTVPGKTEWRRQTGAVAGQRLASASGSYDLNVYSILNNKPGYAYNGTNNNNSYVDAQKKIDLTDVNSANISFKWYCHGNETYAFTGVLLADGTEIVNNLYTTSIPSSWSTANYSLNSFCNKETIITFRMFLISYGSFPSSPGNFGFAVDDIEIKGTESSENFNNLVINKTGSANVTLNNNSNIYINGNLVIESGILNLNNRRIKSYGDITNNGNISTGANGEIMLLSETPQKIKGTSNINIANLTKNSISELIIGDNITDNFTLTITNSFTWIDNNDKIKIGNGKKAKLVVPGDFKINNGSVLETANESTIEINGHYVNYGDYIYNNGEIKFIGTQDSYIIKEPTQVLYYEGFEQSNGGFSLESGAASWARHSGAAHNSNYDLAIKATAQNVPYDYLYSSAADVSATKTIDLTGFKTAELQFWWRCAGVSGQDYGQVYVNNNLIMDNMHGKPMYVLSPRFDISQYANGPVTIRFRWVNNNSGGSSPGLCIDDILITGTSVNMETFYNLSVDKSNNKSAILKCPIDVNNNVTITNGKLDSSGLDFNVGGNWFNYNSSDFIHNNNTIIFDGNNENKNQIIYNNSINKFYNININNEDNYISIENNRLYVENDLNITSGELKANTQDIMIEGNWNNTGGIFDASNKTVYFRGNNNQQIFTNGYPFYNLSLPKQNIPNIGDPAKQENIILNEDILINNNLILSSGKLNNNGKNIEIKGHWFNDGGLFIHPDNATTLVKFSGNNPQTVNLKADGITVNDQNFSFDNVEINGSDVRFHIKTNNLLLYLRNLVINNGKTLKIIQE